MAVPTTITAPQDVLAPAVAPPVAPLVDPAGSVFSPPTHDLDEQESRRLAQGIAIGALVGFLLSLAGVTLFGWLGGMEPGAAAALALFVAVWGGLGFGVMLGLTMTYTRLTKDDAPLRVS